MDFKKIVLSGIFFTSWSFSATLYWLCGPDEDGCYAGIYEYCSCTPMDEQSSQQKYCLDLDRLICIPLLASSHCEKLFVFNHQGECLATLFQSTPTPPCQLVPRSFCVSHNSPICAPDGYIKSCIKESS